MGGLSNLGIFILTVLATYGGLTLGTQIILWLVGR